MDILDWVKAQKWDINNMGTEEFALYTYKAILSGAKNKSDFQKVGQLAKNLDTWCTEQFGDMHQVSKEDMNNGHFCAVQLVYAQVSNVSLSKKPFKIEDSSFKYIITITMGSAIATQFKLLTGI